jgi:hypothetical protein
MFRRLLCLFGGHFCFDLRACRHVYYKLEKVELVIRKTYRDRPYFRWQILEFDGLA